MSAPELLCVGWFNLSWGLPFGEVQRCYTEDLEVEEGAGPVATACGFVVTFPDGLKRTVPTCPECLKLGGLVKEETGDPQE